MLSAVYTNKYCCNFPYSSEYLCYFSLYVIFFIRKLFLKKYLFILRFTTISYGFIYKENKTLPHSKSAFNEENINNSEVCTFIYSYTADKDNHTKNVV